MKDSFYALIPARVYFFLLLSCIFDCSDKKVNTKISDAGCRAMAININLSMNTHLSTGSYLIKLSSQISKSCGEIN